MRLLTVLFALSALFLFCKNNKKTAAPEGEVVELTEDFVKFYEQFHKDSAFQVAHIQFPLPERGAEKMAGGGFSLKLNWTLEDWKFQTLPPLNTGEFQREFVPISPELMVEKITTTSPEVSYLVERRWAKMGGEWWLIFYAAGFVK